MRPGTHYEVLVTFYTEDGTPWATPLGITMLDKKHFRIKLFRGTRTFSCLVRGAEIVVNVISDVEKFLITALKRYYPNWRRMLRFGKARLVNAPTLEDAAAIIEACSEYALEQDDHALVVYRIVNIEVRKTQLEPPCRALNHMLDLIIYLTKIGHLSQEETEEILLNIRNSIDIVHRTCYSEYCRKVLGEIEHILRLLVQPTHQDQDRSIS